MRGRLASMLGPARSADGLTFLAIGLVDSIGTGLYLAGSALFFTVVVGLSAAEVGIGLSIAGVLGLAAQPAIGWLADRWGPRRMLVALHVYRAAGFAAYLLAHDFTSFVIIAALLGVAEQAVFPIYQALAEQMVGPEQRVAMMARMRVVFNAGFTLGGVLASIAIGIGTRLAFDSLILGNAVSFLIAAVLLARLTLRHAAPAAARAARFKATALRDGRYTAVAAINGLMVLHIALLGVGVPLWVSEHTHAPKALVGLLLTINTVLAVLFQVRASRGTETVAGSVRAMRLAGAALVVACLLFAAAGRPDSAVYAVALLVAGLVALTGGELFQSAGGWGLSYALAPSNSRAEYLATFNLGTSAQFVLGPTIVTVGVLGNGTAGWLVLAGVFLLAAVAVGPIAGAAARRAQLAEPEPSAA